MANSLYSKETQPRTISYFLLTSIVVSFVIIFILCIHGTGSVPCTIRKLFEQSFNASKTNKTITAMDIYIIVLLLDKTASAIRKYRM